VDISLTSEEEELFSRALKGDYAPFIEYYFGTEFSGTWYTPEDRPKQYGVLHAVWAGLGKPEEGFSGIIGDIETPLRVVWDPYYGTYPMFLLQHGFRVLPWIQPLVSPQVTKGAVTTGTGSGKTCNIGVMGLTYCALMPGFRYLNGGPTQHQSDLMLGEIVKWATNAPFVKFIERGRGTNPWWVERPYPTIRIHSPIDPSTPSTFVCQTIAQDANNILGGERDWINIDEAGLVANITAAEPRLVSRMRGTRASGLPRWTKLTWTSNPSDSIEYVQLMEKYERLMLENPDTALVMENVPAELNVYITKRQMDQMRLGMTQREQERWLSGSMDAVLGSSEIPRQLLDNCMDPELNEYVEKIGEYTDDFGLMGYELPYERERDYVVVGDVGKSPLIRLNSMNVPCLMVFDITDFPDAIQLAAFSWIGSAESYDLFTNKMTYLMTKYRCVGYYDAGNVSTAFEDVGPFADIPFTEDVYFSGRAGKKQWSLAVCVLLMQHGAFRWPFIKGMWHQARVFDITSKKKPDDILMCLLIFAYVLGMEGTLWSKFTKRFKWEFDDVPDAPAPMLEEDFFMEEDEYRPPLNRYSRISA
jgi:hypothetical protein